MKRIVVLGSTGAVGQQALEVARTFTDQVKIIGLAAHTNHHLLAQQVEEFQPDLVSYAAEMVTPSHGALADRPVVSMELMAAAAEADVVVVATASAIAGLPSTLAAIDAGKTVVLANKEVMVMAGTLIVEAAKQKGAKLYPVDPALSGVWQCLAGETSPIKRVILTASETPLTARFTSMEGRRGAAMHGSSQVGKKARIDALTLMSVGMQAIEAHRLFDVPYEAIEVVLHPQGLIRAMVEFVDGSVKAVLSQPTLFPALQYALSYPDRWANADMPSLDLAKIGHLSFHPADEERYPCLASALSAGRTGGTAPTVLNAANEVAVWGFLTQQIGLAEIPRVVASVVGAHQAMQDPTIDDVYAADAWAREEVPKHTVW